MGGEEVGMFERETQWGDEEKGERAVRRSCSRWNKTWPQRCRRRVVE